MPKLSDLYSPEVIDSIASNYRTVDDTPTEDTKKKVDPFTQITVKQPAKAKGQILFSTVFWKPTTIPDLPITRFKDEDWNAEARLHIPELDPNWVWNKPVLEAFALAMHSGDTTLLHGLQGTGKTCLPMNWCAMLRIPFWRMSCNAETREAHFLGSPSVDYNADGQMYIKQEPTILTDSLKYGGLFCEDEAFRHNSALVLQSLREKSNRTVLLPDAPGRTSDERKLKAPEGRWWYVLTDNTQGSGDETGIFDAEVQDASTLDRIDSVIEVEYLDKQQELKILENHCDLNRDIISGMLDVAKMVRNAFKKQQIMATMSVRGLLSWAEKIEMLGHIGKGLEQAWLNKLGTDDRKVVEDIYHQVFARTITD